MLLVRIKSDIPLDREKGADQFELLLGGGVIYLNITGEHNGSIPAGTYAEIEPEGPFGVNLTVLPSVFSENFEELRKLKDPSDFIELLGIRPRLSGFYSRVECPIPAGDTEVALDGGSIILRSHEALEAGSVVVTLRAQPGNLLEVSRVAYEPDEIGVSSCLEEFVKFALVSGRVPAVRPLPSGIFLLVGMSINCQREPYSNYTALDHIDLPDGRFAKVLFIADEMIPANSVVRISLSGNRKGVNLLQVKPTDAKIHSADQLVHTWEEIIDRLDARSMLAPAEDN